MIETPFQILLSQNVGFTGLISDRLYPVYGPQAKEMPYAIYTVISAPRDYSQDGAMDDVEYRIQLDIFAANHASACACRDAIMAETSGVYNRKITFGSPAQTVTLQGVFVDNERDFYEASQDAAGPRQLRKSIDFLITANKQ